MGFRVWGLGFRARVYRVKGLDCLVAEEQRKRPDVRWAWAWVMWVVLKIMVPFWIPTIIRHPNI